MSSKWKKRLTPTLILLLGIGIAHHLVTSKPQVKLVAPAQRPQLNVDVLTVQRQHHQFTIASFGHIRPYTHSLLKAQVSGLITSVAADFRDGGFFKAGEVLVAIDDRDYRAAVSIARAELAQAKLNLAEEEARAEQALIDWQRIGKQEKAPDLVLRKPQLTAAKAAILGAQAKLEQAQLDLERTKIRAPYNGRITQRHVDVGQYLNNNAEVANVYATDALEVRLPIKNSELPFIALPKNSPTGDAQDTPRVKVQLHSSLIPGVSWQGHIVRTEAAMDEATYQLHVIAELDNPWEAERPPTIGEYVTANIEGLPLNDVIIIPNGAIYQGSYVYVVENGQLQRRDVQLGLQSTAIALITSGLNEGELLVTSPLGQVSSGTLVNIISNQSEEQAP